MPVKRKLNKKRTKMPRNVKINQKGSKRASQKKRGRKVRKMQNGSAGPTKTENKFSEEELEILGEFCNMVRVLLQEYLTQGVPSDKQMFLSKFLEKLFENEGMKKFLIDNKSDLQKFLPRFMSDQSDQSDKINELTKISQTRALQSATTNFPKSGIEWIILKDINTVDYCYYTVPIGDNKCLSRIHNRESFKIILQNNADLFYPSATA